MKRRKALQSTAVISGIAISSSISLKMLSGCTPTGKPTWPPLFLKKFEIDLVSSVADTLLPTTETPGALEVHVPEFIDLMLNDNFSKDDQTAFREGLEEFTVTIEMEYEEKFEKCSTKQKRTILNVIEDPDNEKFSTNAKVSFYRLIKELTILGFYTSEYVMNNMLDYHPVPGRLEGCITFTPEGRLFVNNRI